MTNDKYNRLGFLCLAFCLLMNYPILAIFDRQRLLGGMPLLFVFFFTSWLLLMVFTFLLVRSKR